MERARLLFFVMAGSAAVLSLSGCASRTGAEKETPAQQNKTAGADTAIGGKKDGLSDAVLAPAEDFNLKRDKIPEQLRAIKQIYTLPPDPACVDIAAEVIALDAVLGPDEDDQSPKTKKSRTDKVEEEAEKFTVGAVSSATTSFIPFRSLVRRATGASAHTKKVRRAYLRGLQRRAYLKGVGGQMGCAAPAAPLSVVGQSQRAED